MASSRFMLREVIGGFELPTERVHLVPNGIDPAWWARVQHRPSRRAPLVFTWGRVQYEKGFQVLVPGGQPLRSRVPGIECIIGGRGSYLPELQSQIDLEGASDLVDLPGFLGDDLLRDMVHRAGCVVIPSLYEPFGIVALEALAGGRAIDRRPHRRAGRAGRRHGSRAAVRAGQRRRAGRASRRVLTDDDAGRRDAPARRRLLADRYSWEAIAGATPPSTPDRRPLTVISPRRFADVRGPQRHPASASPHFPPMRPVAASRSCPRSRTPWRSSGGSRPTSTGRGTPRRSACSSRLWPGWRRDGPPGRDAAHDGTRAAGRTGRRSGVVDDLGAVCRRLQTALTGTTWFESREGSPLRSVAYFSPEFGISEALPQYSGGLGVLAGDHLKAASDLGVPLVGVGLLYTEGYFRQRLDADGWQQESGRSSPRRRSGSPTPASR